MIKPSLIFDKNKKSKSIKSILEQKINFFSIAKSNLIIVIGGDGFMLQILKKYFDLWHLKHTFTEQFSNRKKMVEFYRDWRPLMLYYMNEIKRSLLNKMPSW